MKKIRNKFFQPQTLKMLGSGMDYEDSNKLTPLYLGVQKNLTRRGLNILLEAGANLNVVDKSLYTVLHHVSEDVL